MLVEQDMPVADAPSDEGSGAPRQSYNFAPGYHGIVYRANTSDRGAFPRRDALADSGGEGPTQVVDTGDSVTYKLQSMKWGLVPFWTKRNPGYGGIMRSINCRDDSLSTPGGMWATMKARKRCVVIAQGFFEWLKTGPKDKLPHYIRRADGHLMCFAGLWDCAQFEGSCHDWCTCLMAHAADLTNRLPRKYVHVYYYHHGLQQTNAISPRSDACDPRARF